MKTAFVLVAALALLRPTPAGLDLRWSFALDALLEYPPAAGPDGTAYLAYGRGPYHVAAITRDGWPCRFGQASNVGRPPSGDAP